MALDKVAFYETQLERLTEYSRALGFTHLSYSQLIHYMNLDYGHDIVKMLHESGRLDRLSAREIAFIKRAKAVCLAARYKEMREKRNIFQTAAVSAKKFGRARGGGVEAGLRSVADQIERDYRMMMVISTKLLT